MTSPRFAVRMLALAAAVAATVALGGSAGAAPPAQPGTPDTAARHVTVATYNVDFGTDLAPLFPITDPAERMAAANQAYQEMIASNYPARAAAIAALIAKERPDVVGLQEDDTWETFDATHPAAGWTLAYSFRALLMSALATDGVPYDETVVNRTFQAALPISPTTAVRFTDYNVILTRSGLPARALSTSGTMQGQYRAGIPLPALGLVVTRGWASVDVTLWGRTFRFFTTHLEAYSGLVRDAQAAELVAREQASPFPVVVTGDINSTPPSPCTNIQSEAYRALSAAGLVEVWPQVYPRDPCGGFTSGQDSLSQDYSTLDHRIDVIFFQTAYWTAIQTEVIGDQLSDRTPPPDRLWPSDHAGSVGTLRMTQGW